MLADFNIVSETEDTDDDGDDISTASIGDDISTASILTLHTPTASHVPRAPQLDVKPVIAEGGIVETEISSALRLPAAGTVKAEVVEETAEYTEFTANDLIVSPKAEYIAESDILENLKQLSSSDKNVMCQIHEGLDIKPFVTELSIPDEASNRNECSPPTAVSLRLWSKSRYSVRLITVLNINFSVFFQGKLQ